MSATIDIRELNEMIEKQSGFVTNLQAGMDQVIVGQKHLVESLLIGLLADGHILLEGLPGLAKTLAIKTLSELVDADFIRIQYLIFCRNSRRKYMDNSIRHAVTRVLTAQEL